MAKKIMARLVCDNDEIAGIVDRGGEVDNQLKNFTVEDKGIKAKLIEEVKNLLQDGEFSLRLGGNRMEALVSASEKYEFDFNNSNFELVDKAIDIGSFKGVIEKTKTIKIPQEKVEEVFRILSEAGFVDMALETNYKIDAEEFRNLLVVKQSSPEKEVAIEKLKGCVQRGVSFRVAYSKK